jgi:class 3 adenylate cyclase/tetratricopeptide (TPR) repeat protein
MKCPKCQAENRETRKFCKECGEKLVLVCDECGYENLPDEKFCGECGRDLSTSSASRPQALSFEEKLDKIKRYLPKGLTERILAQRDRIEGERRQVTVMFCDLEGFTPMVAKLGPEKAYGVIDQLYEILIHKVHEYDGTVNDMTGDGIMALFGAPIALEDAPQRAIRSALAIHRDMAQFSDRIRQKCEGLLPLRMRIGIHTGPVVVGTLGNDLRVEFKAVGDTVNLASRMEGLAEPGTTYVSGETFELTEGLFRFEGLGYRPVKGKSKPINVYRVLAPSTRKTRFDVNAERGLTPFVGRERELELLLDAFERSSSGGGQIVSIISEAGVGKSRLLYEFRKAIANEDVTFLEGKCLSYSRSVAYHPVIDVLKSHFETQEEDGDSTIRKKVLDALNELGIDEASTLPYILELLSVKDSGVDRAIVGPEVLKDRILESIAKIILSSSGTRPLIMAIEDLHWIDKSSEDLLKHLSDRISGARLFLIVTYRPEFLHPWGGRSYHSQVNLNRLSNRESLTMLGHLIGTGDIENRFGEFILEKTEGVPFFIEEFVKSLIDLKVVEREESTYRILKEIGSVTVPAKIQDVIMARIDSVPNEAKGLLQIGSVAGREFSHDLIRRASTQQQEELLSSISALKDSELLYERGIYPQSTYVFKHALTQEVAYNSLLPRRRKEIHAKIGAAIEDLSLGRLEEHFELLAYHCLQGQDWDRAYKYNREAGLKTFCLSDYEQAQRHFEAALQALKCLPSSNERIENEIDLRFSMRAALFPLGRHEEWGKWIRDAEPLAREIEDDSRRSNVLNYLSNFHWIRGEYQKAIDVGERGLDLARKAADFSSQMATMFHLGVYFFTVGHYPQQIEYHQEVRRRLTGEAALQRHGMANVPAATARSMLTLAMAELGDFEDVEMIGREGVEIADQVGNAFTLILVYDFFAMAYLRHGDVKPALVLLEKAHTQCIRSGVGSLYSYTVGSLGYAYLLSNQTDRALDLLEDATKEENLQAAAFCVAHPLTALADAYRETGQNELAREFASRALKTAQSRGERAMEAWAILSAAEVYTEIGQPEEAMTWYQQGLETASELSLLPLTAHLHKGLGEANRRLGRETEAQAETATALDLYRSLGMTFWLDS